MKIRFINWFKFYSFGWKRVLFVAILSVVLSECLLCFVSRLNLFSTKEQEPDFFMNWYFNQKTQSDCHDSNCRNTIILIESADLDRRQMAELLKCLDSACPKVIGFDVLHRQKGTDAEADSLLINAIWSCGSKIVLPFYKFNKECVKPFYADIIDSILFGSVNFDDPWSQRYEHDGFPTFSRLVAKKFLGTEPETKSSVVDYSPMSMNCIQFVRFFPSIDTTIGPGFALIKNGNPDFPLKDFKDKIVIVGTSNLEHDWIDMKFNVCYFSSYRDGEMKEVRKESDYSIVPGSAILTYQIRSFIESKHSFYKTRWVGNFMVSIFLLIVYILFYYIPEIVGVCLRLKNQIVFRIITPLLKVFVLVFAEYMVLKVAGWTCDLTMRMFDLSLAMVSMLFVNCFDTMFEQIAKVLWVKLKID